jgi:hypothetical protein
MPEIVVVVVGIVIAGPIHRNRCPVWCGSPTSSGLPTSSSITPGQGTVNMMDPLFRIPSIVRSYIRPHTLSLLLVCYPVPIIQFFTLLIIAALSLYPVLWLSPCLVYCPVHNTNAHTLLTVVALSARCSQGLSLCLSLCSASRDANWSATIHHLANSACQDHSE